MVLLEGGRAEIYPLRRMCGRERETERERYSTKLDMGKKCVQFLNYSLREREIQRNWTWEKSVSSF